MAECNSSREAWFNNFFLSWGLCSSEWDRARSSRQAWLNNRVHQAFEEHVHPDITKASILKFRKPWSATNRIVLNGVSSTVSALLCFAGELDAAETNIFVLSERFCVLLVTWLQLKPIYFSHERCLLCDVRIYMFFKVCMGTITGSCVSAWTSFVPFWIAGVACHPVWHKLNCARCGRGS